MTATVTRTNFGNGRQLATRAAGQTTNISETEKWVSVAGGGLMAVAGLTRPSLGGALMAALGGCLMYRGLTGHCHLYGALGLSTAEEHGPNARVAAGHGTRVETSVQVNRPPSEVFDFWRNFENLPRFMRHLKSVKVQGNRSHWEACGPAGLTVDWDAEIINERPGAMIAWGSLPGSDVDTAGSVHFEPSGGGTRVRVNLKYDPPAGKAGAVIAGLFGKDACTMIEEDLQKFKRIMEGGDVATSGGGHSQRFNWPQR